MQIHIFGAAGSGVTTTGQALARQLTIPYFDSDDYFWKSTKIPFTVREDKHTRNVKLKADLDQSIDWILGGSIFQWGATVFPHIDLIIFLLIPPKIRIERLKEREFATYGDIIYTDPDRKIQFDTFIQWATDYDISSGVANRNLYAHEHWLTTLASPVLRLVGDLTTAKRIELILTRLQEENLLPAK